MRAVASSPQFVTDQRPQLLGSHSIFALSGLENPSHIGHSFQSSV